MPSYRPTSRRPIAAAFRRTADLAVRWCVARGIHPDAVSYASVVAAGAAALCFWLSGPARWPWLLLVAPLLCHVRLWMNMLDGMVALAGGKASARGEILNDLPDRVSDVLIFAGVAHSGWCHPLWAYWAAIFALLTAYVGTLGQAVAGRREFRGAMSKPWRMVVLNVAAWVTLALYWADRAPRLWGQSVFDLACALVVAGCVQTIVARLRATLRLLKDSERGVAERR
jgi:phosphatidylglycerophosphate synthase